MQQFIFGLISIVLLVLSLITFIKPALLHGEEINNEENKSELGGLYFGSIVGLLLGMVFGVGAFSEPKV